MKQARQLLGRLTWIPACIRDTAYIRSFTGGIAYFQLIITYLVDFVMRKQREPFKDVFMTVIFNYSWTLSLQQVNSYTSNMYFLPLYLKIFLSLQQVDSYTSNAYFLPLYSITTIELLVYNK